MVSARVEPKQTWATDESESRRSGSQINQAFEKAMLEDIAHIAKLVMRQRGSTNPRNTNGLDTAGDFTTSPTRFLTPL